ncbi:MAG: DHHA1 domain-containing protein [Anaerolineae bacterium]|nr:DHHA1 domain-containing protein [Anaerolineae bacterium]
MSTELAYLDDSFCFEFDAEIVARVTLPDGRVGVILPRTFFFPTGGGQEHDTGTLGTARVTDVLMNDDGTVIHVVDREVTETRVRATIDRARRWAFMQHHSAQHLLSQAILETLGIESVSANINIEHPSTIDLVTTGASGHSERPKGAKNLSTNFARRFAALSVTQSPYPLNSWLVCGDVDLTPGENLANVIVYEDRPIKTYWITEEHIAQVPFRMPPKVSGRIRVVEIEGFDYSACGGTHCTRTGQIGIVKIVKTERRAEKLRVHFIAGQRAFEYFQRVHLIVTHLAREFDTSVETLTDAIARQREALRESNQRIEALQRERLQWEARALIAQARVHDSIRWIVALFRDRAPNELRALAQCWQDESHLAALLASYDGNKVSVVVTCAPDTNLRANELLRKVLTEIGGRGGGDAKIAQGGGAISETQWAAWQARHLDEWLK